MKLCDPKAVGETIPVLFNFKDLLRAATISSYTVTAAVYDGGTDGNPSAIKGAAAQSGQTVTQMVTAGTAGVRYTVTCSVTGSDGSVWSQTALIPVALYS